MHVVQLLTLKYDRYSVTVHGRDHPSGMSRGLGRNLIDSLTTAPEVVPLNRGDL